MARLFLDQCLKRSERVAKAARGVDEHAGGRGPLERILQRQVKGKVARSLLFQYVREHQEFPEFRNVEGPDEPPPHVERVLRRRLQRQARTG